VGVLTRYETRIFLILTARHLKRQMAWTCGSYLSRFGSLVCYLGPLRVAGKMSLISID
jgi:hypothetical protein